MSCSALAAPPSNTLRTKNPRPHLLQALQALSGSLLQHCVGCHCLLISWPVQCIKTTRQTASSKPGLQGATGARSTCTEIIKQMPNIGNRAAMYTDCVSVAGTTTTHTPQDLLQHPGQPTATQCCQVHMGHTHDT